MKVSSVDQPEIPQVIQQLVYLFDGLGREARHINNGMLAICQQQHSAMTTREAVGGHQRVQVAHIRRAIGHLLIWGRGLPGR